MQDELKDLLEAAMYKIVAAQATYEEAQIQTKDHGAQVLMKELADEERQHLQILKGFSEIDLDMSEWDREKIPNLMISEHLTGGHSLRNAGVQGTLLFAMKREQEAVEFYSQMMSALRTEEAKHLCENLVHSELKHKLQLEMLYDDLFYGED